MALSSTLYTGLSGLTTNQTRMNVVGNNIANANTTAFKSSRALFKPEAYVTNAAGGPPDADSGGSNPSQIGLGATVSSIDKDFSEGSIQATGKDTDMAVDGDGFFVVQTADGQKYTRDGSFTLNSDHQLVTASGAFVEGYGVDENSNVVPNNLQNLTIPLGAQISAKATSTIQMTGTLNASGDLATGASGFLSQTVQASGGGPISSSTLLTDVQSTSGTALFSTVPGSNTLTLTSKKGSPATAQPSATFQVLPTSTVADLTNFINQSMGIDTTAAGPPAPGAAVDATGTKIDITGNVGTSNALSLVTLSNGSGSPLSFSADPTSTASGESFSTTATAYDSLGQPVTLDVTGALQSQDAGGGTTWQFFVTSPDNAGGNLTLGSGTLQFDGSGNLTSTAGNTITLDRAGSGADPTLPIKLDFSGLSALGNTTSAVKEGNQDGYSAGTLTDFSVGANGTITGSYSNGETKTLGQIALAKFNNPDGLTDDGGNLYSAGANSGLPIIAAAGSLGTGAIRGQSLELSNVDLSTEFINLIVASTGFTAASRVITTSNQLLTELLNTTR